LTAPRHKEVGGLTANVRAALSSILLQRVPSGGMHWDKPGLTEFCFANRQETLVQINVLHAKSQCFADPQARDDQETQKRRVRESSQATRRA
jgi:hypothetical protein